MNALSNNTDCDEYLSRLGTVYGIALYGNESDATTSTDLGGPAFPVLFIKPRNTYLRTGGVVKLPGDVDTVDAQVALGLIFGKDARNVSSEDALTFVRGAALCLDLTEPGSDLFRPPIREKCRDGFLPIAQIRAVEGGVALQQKQFALTVNGEKYAEPIIPSDSKTIAKAISKVTSYMTLCEGDVLLIPTEGVAWQALPGHEIFVEALGFPPLLCTVTREELGAK
jgi:5-oxopent-3-ene-1,2,5-tricarboxylate decarboxylase/2-hydroxyhepta-2,4-diene-1,7-dioate isomerase